MNKYKFSVNKSIKKAGRLDIISLCNMKEGPVDSGKNLISFLFVFSMFLPVMLFISCNDENIINNNSYDENIFLRFEKTLKENESDFAELIKHANWLKSKSMESRATETSSPPEEDPITSMDPIDNIKESAKQLLNDLKFTTEDINEMTAGEKSHIEDLTNEELQGLALFAYSIDKYIHSNSFSSFCNVGKEYMPTAIYFQENIEHQFSTRSITSQDVVDCFMEATGVAAGIAIVSGLTTGMMGRKVTRTLIKFILTKIGIRTISGIGLFLIAAEMSYCLYTASVQNNNSEYTCVYTVFVPDWWTPEMDIPASTASNLPTVIKDINGNTIFSDIDSAEIGQVDVVFRTLNSEHS